ncbi:hypothetical protein ATY81_01610 [Rhizobium sp. R72]|uniref:hypothetical protein n=1 Tax=unclassified Rhizobium TaxID=2613769 RepID=UPI000B5328A9|nr:MULTISPECIES: hypothetical protein [unclassified Rhizobium]OWW04701.1 hypothetical protein ATY81_01610 [Rhizobium sp. R72]OWW05758.1 hypothetical protein ATY80_01610 [Rhizobium sp. R711]
MQDTDLLILSRAVQHWYLYYDIDPDDQASTLLNRAAIELFDQGHRSVEGIATMLIENFVGPWPVTMNAQMSNTM